MLHDPYIFGQPIYKKEQLYGRENIIEEIKDNFTNKRRINLLHVQRRIGKTSLITCLPQFFTEEQNIYKFVTFSCQGYKTKSTPEILNYLAKDIAATIPGLPKKVREEAHSSYNFFHLFLPNIINEYLSGKKLVILLDEFDVLEEDQTTDNPGKDLFDELETAVKQEEKLFAILVFGRPLKDMDYLEKFLQKHKPVEVGLLTPESTRDLIVEPAKRILEYESGAIDTIRQLSAGHPSLTQLLCSNIFRYCRKEEIKKVTDNHVSLILDEAMTEGEAVLIGFLEPFEDDEKLFFRAVAEAQGRPGDEQLQTIIRNWQSVGKRLVEEYKFLEKKEDQTGYKIKVELVQRWLVENYPLSEEEKQHMGKIPENNQDVSKTNNNNKIPNNKIPTEEENDNSQGPNQIYAFISLLLVFGVFIAVIAKSWSSFRTPPRCSDLLKEIKSQIASGTSEERLKIIEEVRLEENLNVQCPNYDEIYRQFRELLYLYGQEEINNGKFNVGIQTWCSVDGKYTKITEEITKLILLNSGFSTEEKRRLINEIIEQNESQNQCSAYSFEDETNKKNLFQQLEQIDKYYHEQGDNHRYNNFNYLKAVESYCKISKFYSQLSQIKTELENLSIYAQAFSITPQQKKEIINLLNKIGKNNCPAFPDI